MAALTRPTRLEALRHARAALVHGADDATALATASLVLLHLGHDFAAASGAIARALSLNSSNATGLYFGALIHGWSGDPAIAEDYAHRALRLSPFDPLSFHSHLALGNVRVREQRYDEAAAFFANAVQANPRFSTPVRRAGGGARHGGPDRRSENSGPATAGTGTDLPHRAYDSIFVRVRAAGARERLVSGPGESGPARIAPEAKSADESYAPPQWGTAYSITSSASASILSEMVRPSALAVLRLMTSSKLVGCSTGISPGLVPCRILSTKSAARRNKSRYIGP